MDIFKDNVFLSRVFLASLVFLVLWTTIPAVLVTISIFIAAVFAVGAGATWLFPYLGEMFHTGSFDFKSAMDDVLGKKEDEDVVPTLVQSAINTEGDADESGRKPEQQPAEPGSEH